MNICSISDTHGIDPEIYIGVDILTISGDISPAHRAMQGVAAQMSFFWGKFIKQLSQRVGHVVFIAGNHDLFLENMMNNNTEQKFRDDLPRNAHYLRDSFEEIEGVKFYGTPWTPTYYNWSFMMADTDDGLGQKFAMIPDGVDYLLSHGPAYGHNDYCTETFGKGHSTLGQHLGSKQLLKHVKRAAPSALLAGHIHSAPHEYSIIECDNGKTCQSIGVSILDERYSPFYQPLLNYEAN